MHGRRLGHHKPLFLCIQSLAQDEQKIEGVEVQSFQQHLDPQGNHQEGRGVSSPSFTHTKARPREEPGSLVHVSLNVD